MSWLANHNAYIELDGQPAKAERHLMLILVTSWLHYSEKAPKRDSAGGAWRQSHVTAAGGAQLLIAVMIMLT